MRLLITGITGFVGSHMAEYAIARGADVIGSARWRSRTENIEHLRGRIRLIECDLRDSASVRRLLAASAPTHVIHLAAQSFVGASWHMPAETLSTNITAQVNLLEGIREIPSPPRVLIMGRVRSTGWSIRTSCRSGRRTPCARCRRTR
jgi:GDP-4-dehydro-6-deoxy-D-mannose reductase